MRRFDVAAVAAVLALSFWTVAGAGDDKGEAVKKRPAPEGEGRKQVFDPGEIRKLKAVLPDGWKDDSTVLNVRRFLKDGRPRLWVFAILYRGPAPTSAERLADLAKKNPDLFPQREWIKTVGIGKLPDGFFIVGQGKAGGAEEDMIGMVRTIDEKTVLFVGSPADEAGARKEMLALVRSATFGGPAAPGRARNTNRLIAKYRDKLTLRASSAWSGWPVDNAFDGKPETSWFSMQDNAAARDQRPWVQVAFPEAITVRRVTILGNRDPAWREGYTIRAGAIELLDKDGKRLYHKDDKGEGKFSDFDFVLPRATAGVHSIRFTARSDQDKKAVSGDVAVGEFQVE